MQVTILALERYVSRRVAVHAARVHEDRVGRQERLASTRIILLAHRLSDAGLPCPFEQITRNDEEQNANDDYPLYYSLDPVLSIDGIGFHDDSPLACP
jgi:hypothetical protein